MAKYKVRAHFDAYANYLVEAESVDKALEQFDDAREASHWAMEPDTMSDKIERVDPITVTEVYETYVVDRVGREIHHAVV